MNQFDYQKYLKNNPLLKENVNEPKNLLALIQDYIDFDYTADQGYGTSTDDETGEEVDIVDNAEKQKQRIEKEITALKGRQYFQLVQNYAQLSTYEAEYAGPDDMEQLTSDKEETARKLGFTVDQINENIMKEFTDDPQAEEDAETFVSTPEGNKAVATLKSFISRPYEDEELQDLLNMLKLTREQFLTVAQVAGMKLKSGWGGITIKDRNYKGTTPYIEYVPDTRKWWVG
jgi:hypothetical protein